MRSRSGIEEGLYTASASDLLDGLQEVDARVGSVMLIGHEPAIRGLALMLAGSGLDLERAREKFPTAALASLAFQGSWGELALGAAEASSPSSSRGSLSAHEEADSERLADLRKAATSQYLEPVSLRGVPSVRHNLAVSPLVCAKYDCVFGEAVVATDHVRQCRPEEEQAPDVAHIARLLWCDTDTLRCPVHWALATATSGHISGHEIAQGDVVRGTPEDRPGFDGPVSHRHCAWV